MSAASTGPENQDEEIVAGQNEVLNQAAALKDLQGVVEQIKRFKIMYNDFQRQIDELKVKSAQSRGSNGIQSGGFADDPDDGAAGYDDAGLGDAGLGDAGYADAANGGDAAGLADAGYDDAAAGYGGDADGGDYGDAAGGTQVGGAPVAKKVKKSAKTKKTKTKKAKKASA
jgi:hypothetical protein